MNVTLFCLLSNGFFRLRLGFFGFVASQKSDFLKIHLTLPDKKVFKTLFGLNAIVLHKSRGSVVNIFRDLYLKIGHFQPSVVGGGLVLLVLTLCQIWGTFGK